MLSLENITCKRGERTLFEGLGVTVGAKGVLVLKGHNGCGKTTLLKTIAGLLPPDEGTITFEGYDIFENSSAYGGLLHYVGHESAVKPRLTVEQNLLYWARMRETAELVPAAMNCFNLEPFADLEAGKLSAGWQRKVALARLICCHSTIWLMDEPFSNLDDATRERLTEIIQVRADQGGIIVMATHDDIDVPQAVNLNLSEYAPR